MEIATDLVHEELSADVAELTVKYNDADHSLRDLGWATPVYIYNGSDLIGKFYSTGVKRVGTDLYEITATSVIGLFDYDTYYGGMYSNSTFKKVAEDIFLTNGLTNFDSCSRKLHRGEYGLEGTYAYAQILQDTLSTLTVKMKAKVTVNRAMIPITQSGTSCRKVILGFVAQPGYSVII